MAANRPEKVVGILATKQPADTNALLAEIKRLEAALAESEARVNLLQDNTAERTQNLDEIEFQRQLFATQQEASPDAILIVDEQDKILSYNQQFTDLWQMPEEVMQLGRDEALLEFVANQISNLDAFVARIKWLYEHKEARGHDEILLKDGRVIDRITSPVIGANNRYYGRVWYFREITERKHAEDALRTSEERYRAAFDGSPDAVAISHLSTGLFLAVNQQFKDVFGYSAEEAVGHTALELNLWADPSERQRLVDIVQRDGKCNDFEARARKKSGAFAWVLLSASVIEVDSVPCLFIFSRDITEQKRAEEALRMSEERYRVAFQTSIDAISISRMEDGTFLEVNQSFIDIYGYQREEIIGHSSIELNLWCDLNDRNFLVESLQRTGSSRNFEFLARKKSGELMWVLTSSSLMEVDGASCILHYQRDITERKQIEAQLQTSHELLSKLAENSRGFVYQFLMAPDGSFSMPFAGGAIEECFGVTAEEVNADDAALFKPVHPEDLDGLIESVHESARTLQPWNHEFRTHPTPGVTKWLVGTSVPEKLEDGSIVWHGFTTDITEQKKVEREALFLSNLVEQSDFPVFAMDMDDDFRMVFVNQATCEHYNLTKEELLKMRLPDWDPAFTYDMLPQYGATAKQNKHRILETVHRRSDGSTVPVEISSSHMALDGRNYAMGYIRDITERKRTERDLLVLNAALNRLSDSAFLADEQFHFVYANDAACRNLGYTREEFAKMTPVDIDPDLDFEALHEMAASYAEGVEQPSFERRHRTKDGRIFPVEVSVTMIEYDGVVYGLSLCRDITERRAAEEVLNMTQFSIENVSLPVIWVDRDGHFLYANDAACRLYGYSKEEIENLSVFDVNKFFANAGRYAWRKHWQELKESKSLTFDTVGIVRGSKEIPVEINANFVEYGGQEYNCAFVHDIAERKKHEAELLHAANHDAVTGLPNRRLLTDRLEQAVARTQRSGKMLAVCYLDIDNFKPINDEYGHAVGDQLLRTIAEKLAVVLREEDTLARLGGDEFVLLFNQLERVEDVHAILDRLLKEICKPIMIEDVRLTLSASIGVALYPQDDVDAETLLRHADQAMYKAKNGGKNRYYLYDPSHDLEMQERMVNIQQMRTALEKGEFVLHYQPKVNLLNGSVVGAEALIRWQHPERGLLSPAAFLQYIEGDELESEVGEWVIESALKQIEAWNALGLSLHVSVNISAGHLLKDNFAEHLSAMLEQHPNVIPSDLGLEIIETAALTDMSQAFNALQRCKELGVRILLDDFGTGHSSLTHLRQLPVDTLKIDQAFVRDMLTDPSDHGIVLSVVQLAHTFNHEVIAEGVETLEQGAALIKLGCRVMQGYGIARPMPASQMLEWVNEWHRTAIWQNLNI